MQGTLVNEEEDLNIRILITGFILCQVYLILSYKSSRTVPGSPVREGCHPWGLRFYQ
jgi:hypothetical protein